MSDTRMLDLRHVFPPAERVRLAEDLARELIVKGEAERLFAAAKESHKLALERLNSRVRSLTRALCEGWEYRDVPCKILDNDPEPGQQTIVRLDTGEVVEVQSMAIPEPSEHPDVLFNCDKQTPKPEATQ
jgi:hypothetical protein